MFMYYTYINEQALYRPRLAVQAAMFACFQHSGHDPEVDVIAHHLQQLTGPCNSKVEVRPHMPPIPMHDK